MDNLVIFSTLDAQLVALDQNTGKVVWKEKIDDYQAGYSNTAAPIIAKGLLLTGVSGGEFGVIGRVEARDPKTGKMVWVRPTVEGHMGYKYDAAGNKTENGISGTPTPPGRATCGRPAAQPPGWAAATTRRPVWPTSVPATRHRGTATCVPATTCTRARRWRSMWPPARSSGTSRARRTTAGTTTV
jgi:outer membrane protein assembly factor BamB